MKIGLTKISKKEKIRSFLLFIVIISVLSPSSNQVRSCYALTTGVTVKRNDLGIKDAIKTRLHLENTGSSSKSNDNIPRSRHQQIITAKQNYIGNGNLQAKTETQEGSYDTNNKSATNLTRSYSRNINTRCTTSSARRHTTSIEQANQDFKQKRLKDRMQKLFLKVNSTINDDRLEESQKRCDELIGICAASNQWDKYDEVLEIMKQRNLSIQGSTFRSCLKQCYTSGNGNSSMRMLKIMQVENVPLEASDFDLTIGALCKQNEYFESWQQAVDLIKFAAENYDTLNGDGIKVESYNNVLSCMESGKHYKDALSLLSLMEQDSTNNSIGKHSHPSPNIATYHAILKVLIASNRIEEASNLLLSLAQKIEDKQGTNLKASSYTFEIVLSALTRKDQSKGLYREAVKLIDFQHSLNIIVPIEIYNRVISSCAKARKANVALELFATMKAKKRIPDTITYNSLISACANEGMTKKALELFNECKNGGICKPDVITYTNTIRACGQSRMVKKALKLLSDAKKQSISLDVFLYTALIDVCGKDKQWRITLDLLSDMKRNSIIPNQHTYSAIINALGNSGEWERALDVLDQMKEKGMKVNVFTYNSAISALAKASRKGNANDSTSNVKNKELWIKAMDILDEMKAEKVWPDKYSYSSTIACCASGARYQEAIDLIKFMRDGPAKIKPNKIAYTGAMTACARAGEWSHALRLFVDMKADRIECDVVAYNALVSAYMNGSKPDMAFELWNQMCGKVDSEVTKRVKPDIITLTNVIACLERAEGDENLSRMDLVFEDAVERQIILGDNTMDTKFEVDLSGMSLPVARAACRFILNRILRTTNESEAEELLLITGVGKHHQQHSPNIDIDEVEELTSGRQSRTALREYVRQILREDFKPPLFSLIPTNAAGIVQISKDVMMQWMKENNNSNT